MKAEVEFFRVDCRRTGSPSVRILLQDVPGHSWEIDLDS